MQRANTLLDAFDVLQDPASAATAFGIDGNGYLRSISNLGTMSSTVLGLTPFTYGATNGNVGLARSPRGQLYAGDDFGNIWALSMTGVATPIGSTGVAAPITGLDWDPVTGGIFMIGWLDDSWQVTNTAGTLNATHLATGNHPDWTAFTLESVPEPGAGLLLSCGALVLAPVRRRK